MNGVTRLVVIGTEAESATMAYFLSNVTKRNSLWSYITGTQEPESWYKSDRPVLPNLQSVLYCPQVKASVSPKFTLWRPQTKNELMTEYRKSCPEETNTMLRLQLATFAAGNRAKYSEIGGPWQFGHMISTSGWPGGIIHASLWIHHQEATLQSVTTYVPSCPISGSWYIPEACGATTQNCSNHMSVLAQGLSARKTAPPRSIIYLPDLVGLAEEDQDTFLAEQQRKLDDALTGNGSVVLRWISNVERGSG